MNQNKEILSKYVPNEALTGVLELFDKHPCRLKIVNQRQTKHGDFRRYPNGQFQITVNNNLNAYRFLITLIHEIAHLVTYKKKVNVKPHGTEWKQNFQHLMLPFVNNKVFPIDILPHLAKYLINPKARTDGDLGLSMALKKYDNENNHTYIYELPMHSKFKHQEKIYIRGNKRRTRYECVEVNTKRVYLFQQNAEVERIQ